MHPDPMKTEAERVAEILRKGLQRAEEFRDMPLDTFLPTAYSYLEGAVVAAIALLGAHIEFDAYEAEQALLDRDRAAEGWRR